MIAMSENWLTVEEASLYLNIVIRVVRINANDGKYGEIKLEDSPDRGGKDGKIILIPLSGLPAPAQLAYIRDHNLTQPADLENDGWDQEPQWKREIAAERIQILNAWDQYLAAHSDGKKTELTKEFVRTWFTINQANKHFSTQTLYLWRQKYRASGRTALLPGWGEAQREESIDPQAWSYFDTIYGDPRKRNAGDCYRELQTVALVRGWKLPSLRTFQRAINRYPKSYWINRREGKRMFEENCLPAMRRDRESIRSGEIWVGDGHDFDFFVKGKNGKPARTVLSGWVDMRSVKWMGWNIDYSNDTNTVMSAFAHGSLNPDNGLPYELYLDNGREYDNTQFAYGGHRRKTKDKEKYDEARIHSLVNQLGITVHFAIPKNARAKIIEREFKEVAQLFSKRFATYCGSNPDEKPENLNTILKDPANLPELQTVRELFAKFITTERNQRITQGQGRKNETPDQVFYRTRLPIRRVPESVLKLCFMPHTRPLTVGRDGIEIFDSLFYNDLLIKHLGDQVIVRYRNEDLSKVYIFTLQDQFLCEAAMMDLHHITQATQVEYEEHKRLRKRAKARIEEIKNSLPDHGGILSFPEYLDIRAKQCAASAQPPPERENVVAMVPVNPNLLQSAITMQKMQKLAVGGEHYQSQEDINANLNVSFAKLDRALKMMQNSNGGK